MRAVFESIVQDINSKYSPDSTYRTDMELHGVEEYWSELQEIDGRLYGDCDSYCITIANRAIREGIPASDLKFHLVGTGRKPDHLILEYKGLYADCNSTRLTRRPPYRLFSHRRLDQADWQIT